MEYGQRSARAQSRTEELRMRTQPKQYKALEQAIDSVVESYADETAINNLESAALPNKRAVIDALREISPVIYMGFYAHRALNRDNLRHGVAEHLYRAHDILVEQIERALTYQNWYGDCSDCPEPGSGEKVVLDLVNSLPRVRRLLDGDMHAAYEGDPAAESIEEIVFSYPSITAITTYRVAHELWKARVPMIPRILSEYAHSRTGIDIHPGATIGQRFFIDHGTGVVVGETAVLGDDVKLYQGVTLGALSVPRRGVEEKRHPTLEDNVTVYAGATILGGDTVIGQGSTIGGNVWLVDSVPAGSKVFGNKKTGGEGLGT
ncbi:MAG: serine O-acetyltransferase EpsC [Polyangiales bacterium]